MYEELVMRLRKRAINIKEKFSRNAELLSELMQAADAIEELYKAAKKMHLWIFNHTCDELAAYDECGLSDEMNAALGYCAFEVRDEPPKEET